MKKLILSLLALITFGLTQAQAINVSLSKGLLPGFNVQDQGGNVITSFNIFIGSFDNPLSLDTPVTALQGVLASSFNEYGRATAPQGGLLTANVTKTDFSTNPATDFNSKSIYVIVTNGATFETSDQFAVLTLADTSPANTWVFPSDVSAPIGTANARTGLIGDFRTVIGSTIDNATGPESLRLAAIPEPSALAFAALGLTICLGRRKK